MKERPILFSAPMVRALLEGRKTQTRRVVKCNFQSIEERDDGVLWPRREDCENATDHWYPCPYGQPGDRLWVRECFADEAGGTRPYLGDHLYYRAEPQQPLCERWTPSIHMPRWASRILLEVVSVRVERLQDISEADAKAEGVIWDDAGQYWQPSEDINCPCCFAYGAYAELWESINGRESWDANPWVWVVEFRRVTP